VPDSPLKPYQQTFNPLVVGSSPTAFSRKSSGIVTECGSFSLRSSSSQRVLALVHGASLPIPPSGDFRLLSIGPAYRKSVLQSEGGGVYLAKVDKPAEGWTAFFAELVYDSGGDVPYKLTTQVQVVPDVLPHSFDEFRKGIK
jgi:hypothetical protein